MPVLDRAAGRDERLARDLATEHALTVLVGAQPAEQVHLELFELQQFDQLVERSPHGGAMLRRACDPYEAAYELREHVAGIASTRLRGQPKKTAAVSKSLLVDGLQLLDAVFDRDPDRRPCRAARP